MRIERHVVPKVRALVCPSGSIGAASAQKFLALPSVACVGGPWIVPKAAIDTADWARITVLARDAAGLRG